MCSDPSARVIFDSMWFYVEQPWQYEVLDRLPAGVDWAELERARRMTLAERLDAVEQLVELGEKLAAGIAKKAAK